MRHIFISYAHEDASDALRIHEALLEKGLTPWLDEKKLLPGQDWKLEIENAIRDSDIFIACISHNSVSKKGFVQSELKQALEVLDTIPEGNVFMQYRKTCYEELGERLAQRSSSFLS